MKVFQHPHLTRGIVQTVKGAFILSRGRVEMPEDVGESLGWRSVDRDDDSAPDAAVDAKASALMAVTTKA